MMTPTNSISNIQTWICVGGDEVGKFSLFRLICMDYDALEMSHCKKGQWFFSISFEAFFADFFLRITKVVKSAF